MKKALAKKAGKSRRVLRRYRFRYRYVPPSPAMRRFRIFEHDFNTLIEAAVRAGVRSPAAIVRDAELAAVAMGEAIAARRPKTGEGTGSRFHRRNRSPWREWQSFFDRMVHQMSERTTLSAAQVVKRSEQITDMALEVLRARRAAMRSA